MHVPSSSLVPAGDDTLLFTNAGMVQFKNIFLGKEQLNSAGDTRVVTCQKCVRAGGKHNDLENVGYTKRHHTFFEMLGNFSFGDYFKREAIKYAWEFLTGEEWLHLDPKDLWVTVHKNDAEAKRIWLEEMHVDPQRFSECGDADNFWAMGEVGPCGYCSEIYFDYGAEFAGTAPDGIHDTGDRYVEIWNLVFMEFERDAAGKLTNLAKPCIDTGMGLERIAAVMQRNNLPAEYVGDNYHNDLLKRVRKIVCDDFRIDILGKDFFVEHDTSVKVIVDHMRAIVFLIADGVLPSNEGRGYVLRRIIRRAVRHARLILTDALRRVAFGNEGRLEGCLLHFAEEIISLMESVYFEIRDKNKLITEIVLPTEINKFSSTLENGERYFEEEVARLEKKSISYPESNNSESKHSTSKNHPESKTTKSKIIPGAIAFRLYDTYGFPLDLTVEMAKERGLTVDMDGFNQAMEKQRDNSRAASKFGVAAAAAQKIDVSGLAPTKFIGYIESECAQSKILALYHADGSATDYLAYDEEGIIVLDVTPFYAEAGGQIGDSGEIYSHKINAVGDGIETFFKVTNTQKCGGVYLHYGTVLRSARDVCVIDDDDRDDRAHSGVALHVGQMVYAAININRRQAIKLNHSAAHLLHKALHHVVGEHALQRGSAVDDERLRFDFAHFNALTAEELCEIEEIVNRAIRSNLTVTTAEKALAAAKAEGVLALFDEKYGDVVRVVTMKDDKTRSDKAGADFSSQELCGGTHVAHTGEIGKFKIVLETSIAAGVRRIEAVTGENELIFTRKRDARLSEIATLLKAESQQEVAKVRQLMAHNASLEKEIGMLQAKMVQSKSQNLAEQAQTTASGAKILVSELEMEGVDAKLLRQTLDSLKQQLQSAVIVLTHKHEGKIQLVAGVTQDLVARGIKAGEIVQYIAPLIDGSGGGRADMAQGGGTNVTALTGALDAAREWIAGRM